MKKISFSSILAMLVWLNLASGAFAQTSKVNEKAPFKGSMQAVETYTYDFTNMVLYVSAEGSGNSTQLGHYSIRYSTVVDLNTLQGSGLSAELVAANGDKIFAEGSGHAVPGETTNILLIEEQYTITGGTGRFTGIQGSFSVERTLNSATSVTWGTFSGNVIYP